MGSWTEGQNARAIPVGNGKIIKDPRLFKREAGKTGMVGGVCGSSQIG